MKISIVTGTLNRKHLLPKVIENTVDNNDKLELVLVDGGSNDGTIEYLHNINHPKIKLIEYGKRSTYPHFMNLGIKNSSYDLICQWNDDVILLNDWEEVFNEIDDHDAYLFAWYNDGEKQWNLLNRGNKNGEVVMNYGIYKRHVFENIGMYNYKYKYYFADAEMGLRTYCSGYKIKNLYNIHVNVFKEPKKAIHYKEDANQYYNIITEYHKQNIDKDVEYLK